MVQTGHLTFIGDSIHGYISMNKHREGIRSTNEVIKKSSASPENRILRSEFAFTGGV